MNTPSRPSEAAQSFVIRLWQERPRHWRGTVRHVQSDAQRGFSKLDQAVDFIEQRASVTAPTNGAVEKKSEPNAAPRLDLGFLTARRLRPVYALAGVAVLVILALLLANPGSNVPLAGAAVTGGGTFEVVSAFVAGLVLGGLGVGWWLRSSRPRDPSS